MAAEVTSEHLATSRAPDSAELDDRSTRFDVAERSPASPELGAFVALHYPRLVRLSALICRSSHDAEDAVQAALERAWRRRRTIEDAERLRPWLDKIVVRESLRLLNARQRIAELHIVPDVQEPPPPTADLAVRIALTRLSPEQRASVVLHLYAGYTVPATARLLEIPEETVRSRLRVARQQLRSLLGEESAQ